MKTNTTTQCELNTLKVRQNTVFSGEIAFFIRTEETEITDSLRERAERQLREHPGYQGSYYDLLLVNQHGKELDFETNVL